MSRTFQHVRLLPLMSVIENVAIGAHLRGHKGFVAAACRADRAEEARLLHEAALQIERCRPGRADVRAAGSLPLGQQRIVEIARALPPTPACCSSTSRRPACATWKTGARRPAAQAAREGMGILLVEHDMDFVMGLADRVVVMEFGREDRRRPAGRDPAEPGGARSLPRGWVE
jgi:ABC-type branched-subunit amino acid transport system ATPase component